LLGRARTRPVAHYADTPAGKSKSRSKLTVVSDAGGQSSVTTAVKRAPRGATRSTKGVQRDEDGVARSGPLR
jgi:hypothetical protein